MSVATPTGVVDFYDGGALVASSSIVSGRATLTSSTLAAGSHAITARYRGLGDIPPASSAVFVQVVKGTNNNPKATVTTLTATPNPSTLGTAIDLVAMVTEATQPSGRVLLMVDDVVIGDPAGQAITQLSGTSGRVTFTLSNVPHGRHKVTATYLGNASNRGSTNMITVTVN
jgi:hypothetical protein